MKRAFWWELETPTGVDPSWRTLLDVHSKEGGMKRKEQTCQDKAKIWQPMRLWVRGFEVLLL